MLCERNAPEFGFICFRAPTVVQYLAMVEIEAYFKRQKGEAVPEHKTTEVWKQGFHQLYTTLDNCIKRVMEACDPEHWIISSDHGAVPYKYRLNINRFLQDQGYQPYSTSLSQTVKNVGRTVLKGQPFQLGRQADLEKATAFGHWYLTGIFVNDSERFGGPVDPADVPAIMQKLCNDFNSTPEAKKYEMEAKPYRSLYPDAKFNAHLPDVKIHCSEEIFFSRFPGPFVRPSSDYKPLETIENVKGGMHSGQKGRHPIFCCSKMTAALIDQDDSLDLTLVYKLTERVFA